MYIPTYMAVLVWILALFGIIALLARVILGFRWSGIGEKGGYNIIIWARNQDDTIEGLIREIILKSEIGGQEEAVLNVVLVDGDSSDNTSQIMERLAKEYGLVKLSSCQELFHNLEQL